MEPLEFTWSPDSGFWWTPEAEVAIYQLVVDLCASGAHVMEHRSGIVGDEMRPNVHVDYFLDQLDKVLDDDQS
jgi:hypothetical protein